MSEEVISHMTFTAQVIGLKMFFELRPKDDSIKILYFRAKQLPLIFFF